MHYKLSYLTIKKTLFPNAEVIVGGEEEEVSQKKKKKEKKFVVVGGDMEKI
jgi:hypothetical protein